MPLNGVGRFPPVSSPPLTALAERTVFSPRDPARHLAQHTGGPTARACALHAVPSEIWRVELSATPAMPTAIPATRGKSSGGQPEVLQTLPDGQSEARTRRR